MSFALKAARRGRRVAVICKTTLEEANTALAQEESLRLQISGGGQFRQAYRGHTMIAGDWLSDREAVEKVVRALRNRSGN